MPPRKKKRIKSATNNGICVIHFSDVNEDKLTFLNDDRFKRIKQVAELKTKDPTSSQDELSKILQQVPSSYTMEHGYHRECYKRFTRNVERLATCSSSASITERLKPQRQIDEKDKIKFVPNCIFCQSKSPRYKKVAGHWTKDKLTHFQPGKWRHIVKIAEQKGDERLLTRIRGYDLACCGALFHRSCRQQYGVMPQSWQSKSITSQKKQTEMCIAHQIAFNKVVAIIEDQVIRKGSILKLSEIKDTYIRELKFTKFANDSYRSEKLKRKIEKHPSLRNKVGFVKLDNSSKYSSSIIYNINTEISTAIKLAYSVGNQDNLVNVAMMLRKTVSNAYKNLERFSWPPTLEYLEDKDILPKELQVFLRTLFSGEEKKLTAKTERLVLSVGQDICRHVTNSQWKLPKHILLVMTLRHLFRSKELITLLNRFGHCENYSFSLELETAIAAAVRLNSSILTDKIIRNPVEPSVFHSEFDNYDQLINDLSGKGSIHTAHGIMLQEVDATVKKSNSTLQSIPREKKRSLPSQLPSHLDECYISQRKSPVLNIQRSFIPGSNEAYLNGNMKDRLWLLLRSMHAENQMLPCWAGFVSQTGVVPQMLTSIDYYPVIYKPITEYATVLECLRYAAKATDEVGQHFVYTTFDLGVCMKAYPLIWSLPYNFDRHIVLIGTFHLIMGYLNMMGKKMDGSGFSDILLEANLTSSGSITGVLSGKNYSRAVRCHKVLFESLNRLVIRKFLEEEGLKSEFEGLSVEAQEHIQRLSDNPCSDDLEHLLKNNEVIKRLKDHQEFCEGIRKGEHGKTPQFWMTYLDHVSLVLSLMRAVKENDFELYAYCLMQMPNLFFSFGGQNYSRYLTFFSVFIANLDFTHPGAVEDIKRGVISVARSFIAGNRCSVDKTMEETFMRNAKSKGGAGGSGMGISGLTQNYSAYQRWIATMAERSKYLNATRSLVDLESDTTTKSFHRDCRPAEIRKSECAVKATIEAITNFMDPFSISDKSNLYGISSGCKIPNDIVADVMSAEEVGENMRKEFIERRLNVNENFFDPIKRTKLKTMGNASKTIKVTTKENKIVELKQQGNVAFQLLLKMQNTSQSIDLQEIMKYQLTPVPSCLGSSDGYLGKTDKSKGMHYLLSDVANSQPPNPSETLLIIDGNAVFHCLMDLPGTFRQICEKIFCMIPKNSDVIFSTDMYSSKSIKTQERIRRGCSERFLVSGPNIRRPADWKQFLSNDENKKALAQMLLRCWSDDSFVSFIGNRKVILIVEGNAHLLQSSDGITVTNQEIHSLRSSQEETDTRVVLYAKYGASQGYANIRVRSPDSDIFFILLHFSSKIDSRLLFDSGSGNNKILINMTDLANSYGPKKCTVLLCLHAYTGCDTCSAFKGIGKIKPIKIIEKKTELVDGLVKLGESWQIDDDSIKALEILTCSFYGSSQTKSLNSLRLIMLSKRCKSDGKLDPKRCVDLASLPPCLSTHIQHVKRCNLQIGIWKRALENFPEIPDADDHGWVTIENVLEPLWCEQEILPRSLSALLETHDEIEEENFEEEEDSGDSDVSIEY